MAIPSDLEIAQAHRLTPIVEIARNIGLDEDEIELYGRYKAKISLSVLDRLRDRPDGKLIDVTAITPTPLGEGKTLTTIGLTQGLGRLGKRAICTIRQPSMGPVFGIKGGAAGGGYSQVVPMEDLNLHFTGDIHAVALAHNLLAAMVDASLFHGNPHGLDPLSINWPRVIDVNDRVLRQIVVGLGGRANGNPRETGFDVAVASEVMAVLALTTGMSDLRRRLGRMVVGYNGNGQPVTAEDIQGAGAMATILKDAIKPNLIQTLEGQPCIVHAGPFANIAHGQSSVLADRVALKLADYVVTESGFGADLGMQKFMDIKCRQARLRPNCVVVTCTIRALKMHGGVGHIVPGRPLPEEILRENVAAVEVGCRNLAHMIKIAHYYGVPVVVAINRFATDTEAEIETVRRIAIQAGARTAYPSTVHADGGAGAADLARAVVEACAQETDFRFLYQDDLRIREKIEIMATRVYNASVVSFSPLAEKKIEQFEALGWGRLPICMAKTHLSISHDPALKNVPDGYVFPIRDIRPSVGAGFLYPLAGTIMTMPGLPSRPAAHQIDVDEEGRITGLF
ncbi:MAG: formate--tetrahydrofolate ligase [Clostridia bacterium]|nr:formate--tetrahydrofolate ligase [Clostridia bacterium]MDQ7791882.1 formate--tetrahydrofolate ligase [Clostridia bacterium]